MITIEQTGPVGHAPGDWNRREKTTSLGCSEIVSLYGAKKREILTRLRAVKCSKLTDKLVSLRLSSEQTTYGSKQLTDHFQVVNLMNDAVTG